MWIQLLILELIDGAGTATVTPVTPTTTTPGGVRRARFLRRAPKLPWDKEEEPQEEQVLVSKPKRRRIPLPEVQAFRKATDGDVPIQTIQEISAPAITIPPLGTARLKKLEEDDEDDLLLWLI